MDDQALGVELDAAWAKHKSRMIEAMAKAPKTNIIGGSEWQVRAAFDQFRGECFETLVGARVGQVDQEAKAALSPSGRAREPRGPAGSAR